MVRRSLLGFLLTGVACAGSRMVPPGGRLLVAPLDEQAAPYHAGPPWCFSEEAGWLEYELARLQGQVEPSAPSGGGVEHITDEGLCRAISMALDSSFFQAPRAQAVVVYRLPDNREPLFRGVRYVVRVPPLMFGEYGAHAHLDDSLRVFANVFLR